MPMGAVLHPSMPSGTFGFMEACSPTHLLAAPPKAHLESLIPSCSGLEVCAGPERERARERASERERAREREKERERESEREGARERERERERERAGARARKRKKWRGDRM